MTPRQTSPRASRWRDTRQTSLAPRLARRDTSADSARPAPRAGAAHLRRAARGGLWRVGDRVAPWNSSVCSTLARTAVPPRWRESRCSLLIRRAVDVSSTIACPAASAARHWAFGGSAVRRPAVRRFAARRSAVGGRRFGARRFSSLGGGEVRLYEDNPRIGEQAHVLDRCRVEHVQPESDQDQDR